MIKGIYHKYIDKMTKTIKDKINKIACIMYYKFSKAIIILKLKSVNFIGDSLCKIKIAN